MNDLITVLNATLAQAQSALNDMRTEGMAHARAKAEYRKALARKILELRKEGFPATYIPELARGDDLVAEKCFERDCAEIRYNAARETVLLRKKEADTLREQIAREWQ